jgi:hypothetical protein
MKQFFADTVTMLRDNILSKKFIGVIASSYFLHEKLLSGELWAGILLFYLGFNVWEKKIDSDKKV